MALSSQFPRVRGRHTAELRASEQGHTRLPPGVSWAACPGPLGCLRLEAAPRAEKPPAAPCQVGLLSTAACFLEPAARLPAHQQGPGPALRAST